MSATIVLSNREQLDTLLDELNERGVGEAAAIDSAGSPYLLAAYELPEACEWDAFGQHPYSTEGDPDDLQRLEDVEELWMEIGTHPDAVVLSVLPDREHPGLNTLRFPVTVLHEDRA